MKNLFLLFLLISVKSICDGHHDINDLLDTVDLHTDDIPDDEDHIVKGVPISIQNAPYQVQLYGSWVKWTFCGGSIIHEDWILTAAHCLYKFQNRKDEIIILTGSPIRHNGVPHKIERIIIHENFDSNTLINDIALIKLTEPIELDDAQQKIDFIDRQEVDGDTVFITGFGKNATKGQASNVLEAAVVPVVNLLQCADIYFRGQHLQLTAGVFCAGDTIRDTCQGDSGGPAVIDGKLAGIVSFGMECADKYFPGVYTSVQRYEKWIEYYTGIPGIGHSDVFTRSYDDEQHDFPIEKIDDPEDNYQHLLKFVDNSTNKDYFKGVHKNPVKRVPYHVQVTGSKNCGGVILNKLWVLTAAQCLDKTTDENKTVVLIGSMTRNGGIPQEVERKIIHKRYDPETHENDIALLKLKSPLVYSNKVKKVKIGEKLPKKGRLIISGYSTNNIKNKTPKNLRATYTPRVGLKKCKNSMICVADSITCLSELGGPVIIKGELFGIASYDCANNPPVYTLVSEYRSWIESITLFKDL